MTPPPPETDRFRRRVVGLYALTLMDRDGAARPRGSLPIAPEARRCRPRPPQGRWAPPDLFDHGAGDRDAPAHAGAPSPGLGGPQGPLATVGRGPRHIGHGGVLPRPPPSIARCDRGASRFEGPLSRRGRATPPA